MKTPFWTYEETGVAEPEIPTEELDEYVELEQPPEQEPPRYNLRQRKPWLQEVMIMSHLSKRGPL